MLLAKSRADELTIHIEEVSIGGASSSFYLDSSVSVIVLAVLTMVSGWVTLLAGPPQASAGSGRPEGGQSAEGPGPE